MKDTRSTLLFSTLVCCLLFFLAACSSGNVESSTTPTPTTTSHGSQTSSPVSTKPTVAATSPEQTQPMPPTQTSCPVPVSDAARAAVMLPLALGSAPALVYVANTGTQDQPTSAELKWYDVANGVSTLIIHLPNEAITQAQISRDGQWVLFVADSPQSAALQLVRVDGEGLQTLYCAPPDSIQGVQWSPDQSQIIFSVRAVSGLLDLYLLKLSSGQLLPELVQLNDASTGYLARTWADNARVYVTEVSPTLQLTTNELGLYLLDTSKGPHQSPANLLTVSPASALSGCWDFDSDYAATTLAISRCDGNFSYSDIRAGNLLGPSSIVRGTITGGQVLPVYQNSGNAVTQVRFLGYSSSLLLFTINTVSLSTPGVPVNSAPNGIWKMDKDGSVTKLGSEDPGYLCELNLSSQYPWANVSRGDGAFYAVQISSLGNGTTPPTALEYGSINGGPLTVFASVNEFSGSLAIAGWTTM